MEMEQNVGVLNAALRLLRMGISIVPVHNNQPTVDIEEFQRRRPTVEEVTQWFSNLQNDRVGLICGKISRGLVYAEIRNNFGKYAGKNFHKFYFCPDAEGKLENMIIGKENAPFQVALVTSGLVIPEYEDRDYREVPFEYLFDFYYDEIDLITLFDTIEGWKTMQKFWRYADKFQQYYEISADKNGLILAFSGFLRKYLNLSLIQARILFGYAIMKTKNVTTFELPKVIEEEILPKIKYVEVAYILLPEYVSVEKWFKEANAEQLLHELFDLLHDFSLDKYI